jgi:hypothetical protein
LLRIGFPVVMPPILPGKSAAVKGFLTSQSTIVARNAARLSRVRRDSRGRRSGMARHGDAC